MDKNYIIETKNLTKQYGSQKSVADLNILPAKLKYGESLCRGMKRNCCPVSVV